jgi:hypothetical protein
MKKTTRHLIAEVPSRQSQGKLTIGIDVGDVWSLYCTLWLSLLRIETIQTYASS